MIAEQLDALQARSEGCTAVAFADLSSKMVLVTDTQSNLPREVLDDLCQEAALLLGSGAKPLLAEMPSTMATATSAKQTRLFLRATDEPNDILCCLCVPQTDIARMVTDARACLDQISGTA